MYNIDEEGKFSIVRGDSAVVDLTIMRNDEEYTLQEGDVCVLTVKKSVNDKDFLIQKPLVNGQFIFVPDDTSGLEYDKYRYDVQFTGADGFVDTIIKPNIFKVEPEVTW